MNDFLQSLRNGQAEKQRTPKTRKNFDNAYQYSSGPRFNSYGGGYPNTRNPQMKRPPAPGISQQPGNQMPAEDPSVTLLADVLDNLTTQIDSLVKNQEYMITVQERTADLLQRQADAMEVVMAHLNISSEMEVPAPPAFEHHYVSSQAPEEDFDDGTVEDLLKAELEQERMKEGVKKPAKPVLRKRRKVVSAPPTAQPKAEGKLIPRDEIINIINTMRAEGATYDQVAKHLIDLGQPTFSGRGEWHAQTIHRLCSRK